MQIKPKHFYYNETENALVFVQKIETRQDGVEIVWAARVNSDHTFTYYANGFLERCKLVGFVVE